MQAVRSRARRVLLTVAAVAAIAAAGLVLAVESEPRVEGGRPDAAAAERTRDVAERLRLLLDGGDVAAGWSATEAEMNAVLASAERLLPGMRGRASVDGEILEMAVSLGAPLLPSGLWANVELGFAGSERGIEVASARVGRLPLPAALAERALGLGLDRALGPGAGEAAVASVAGLALVPGEARVAFRTDEEGRVPLLELLRSRARGAAGTDARALAAAQLRAIHAAVRAGELPRRGSVVAYVRFVVEAAGRQDGPPRERARGALYALALYCGDPGFETAVGVSLPPRMQGRRNGCGGTTLGGRDDLRRHFAISAGLDAATSGTAAFGMGELKELIDSNPGGSGFSFDDVAADAAGVRFARTFLAAPPEAWPGLAARIGGEAAVLPSLAGLPSRLSADEFEARYGGVDGDAYAALVAEIDRRVEALPLHGARF